MIYFCRFLAILGTRKYTGSEFFSENRPLKTMGTWVLKYIVDRLSRLPAMKHERNCELQVVDSSVSQTCSSQLSFVLTACRLYFCSGIWRRPTYLLLIRCLCLVRRMEEDIVEVAVRFRGLVIGTGGRTVKRIKQESGADVRNHPNGFLVRGPDPSRQSAKEQILQIVEQVSGTRMQRVPSASLLGKRRFKVIYCLGAL